MYIPGTILMWLAFLAGLASTVTYWLSIKAPERWRSPARQSYVLMTAAVVVASVVSIGYTLCADSVMANGGVGGADKALPPATESNGYLGSQAR